MVDSNKKSGVVGGGISPVAAAVAGAVVGAGAVIVGALTMKEGKAEEKVRKVVGDVKDGIVGSVDMAKEKVVEGRESLKKVIDDATDLLRNEAENAKKEVKKVWQK